MNPKNLKATMKTPPVSSSRSPVGSACLLAWALFCTAVPSQAKPFTEEFNSDSFLSTWYRVNASDSIFDSNETGIKWNENSESVQFAKAGNLGISFTGQPVEVGETAQAIFTLNKEDDYTPFGLALSAVSKPELRPAETMDRLIMIRLQNYKSTGEDAAAYLSFNDDGTYSNKLVGNGLNLVPGNTYRFSLKRDSSEEFSYSITDVSSGETMAEGTIAKGVANIGQATLYFQFWAQHGDLLDAKVIAADAAVSK